LVNNAEYLPQRRRSGVDGGNRLDLEHRVGIGDYPALFQGGLSRDIATRLRSPAGESKQRMHIACFVVDIRNQPKFGPSRHSSRVFYMPLQRARSTLNQGTGKRKGRGNPAPRRSALAMPTAPEAATAMEASTHAWPPKPPTWTAPITVRDAGAAEMGGAKTAIHTNGATHAVADARVRTRLLLAASNEKPVVPGQSSAVPLPVCGADLGICPDRAFRLQPNRHKSVMAAA
jgi:hypothetical protein